MDRVRLCHAHPKPLNETLTEPRKAPRIKPLRNPWNEAFKEPYETSATSESKARRLGSRPLRSLVCLFGSRGLGVLGLHGFRTWGDVPLISGVLQLSDLQFRFAPRSSFRCSTWTISKMACSHALWQPTKTKATRSRCTALPLGGNEVSAGQSSHRGVPVTSDELRCKYTV